MNKRPKLTELFSLFDSESAFSLTETQYEEMTGAAMPKNPYYLLKNSALAKAAADRGFEMQLCERRVTFKKIR